MERTLQNIIHSAIQEASKYQDKVSSLVINNKQECFVTFLVKNSGIVSGTEVIKEVYRQINPSIIVEILKEEGFYINKGDAIASAKGKMIDVLKGSNVVIGYLQHLSSVTSAADKYLQELVNMDCELVIDNQYTPCYQSLEENALLNIGCVLRVNDDNTFIINENHLLINGSIRETVEMVRKKYNDAIIELEVKTKDEYMEALDTSVNKITLLNMKDEEVKELVNEYHENIKIGVSNTYAVGKIRSIAKMGVDYIIINNLMSNTKGLDVYLKVYKRSVKNK